MTPKRVRQRPVQRPILIMVMIRRVTRRPERIQRPGRERRNRRTIRLVRATERPTIITSIVNERLNFGARFDYYHSETVKKAVTFVAAFFDD